ncbi:HigA family addiction module antidote protein [Lonepinella koalarum]|uniref:HigA family addiction module antitoxin n=1 Tax=Lonepinella koalarum TaxID=53417 RepID=UPI0011E4A9DF|nr:HigA family addiction module antidote protein [Lonepinella koalarum]
MYVTQRKPTPVGEILQEEFLTPLNLKIGDLAEMLDVHRNTVSAIVNSKSKISLEMAMKLAKAFDTTAEFWLNLQNNVDLWELNHNVKYQQSLEKVKTAKQWTSVPNFAL